METKYFSLGPSESSSVIKIIRILFGLVCIAIAIFWMIFNIRSVKCRSHTVDNSSFSDRVWIIPGMGRSWQGNKIHSEVGNEKIILKKNSILGQEGNGCIGNQ